MKRLLSIGCSPRFVRNQKIKIVVEGTGANVYVDGKDITDEIVGFEVRWHGNGSCAINLHCKHHKKGTKLLCNGWKVPL